MLNSSPKMKTKLDISLNQQGCHELGMTCPAVPCPALGTNQMPLPLGLPLPLGHHPLGSAEGSAGLHELWPLDTQQKNK